MRRLSLKQLKEEYENRQCEYVFALDDQDDRFSSYITCLDLVFDTMLVSHKQSAICFQTGQRNTIMFDAVKCVEESHSSDIGSIFDIICKSRFDEERRYRIWARPRDP